MTRDASDDEPTSPERGVFSAWRLVGALLVAGCAMVLLPWTEAEPETTRALTAQFALRDGLDQLQGRLDALGASKTSPLEARLDYRGPERSERTVRRELTALEALDLDDTADARLRVRASTASDPSTLEVRVHLERADGERSTMLESARRLGGWESILPPLIAIVIALFFRRLLVGLVSAVWLGAAMQVGFDPIQATWRAGVDYVLGNLGQSFNLSIIGFTFALVGMVHVMIRMGGIAGILERFAFLARSARSTRLATALMGLALFFDDYANTIVVGSTMRPLTDEQRISREKLAYLVDSTSAPIAGLAVVSTWIGYEVGLFEELSRQLALGMSGYEIFFSALPMRFYCIFTLVFALLIAIWGRDFGPMLTAERRAWRDGDVIAPGSTPMTSGGERDVDPKEGVARRWYNGVLPVAAVLGSAVVGMYWSGWRGDGGEAIPSIGALLSGGSSLADFAGSWATALPQIGTWTVWRDALSQAANAEILLWSSLIGSLVAVGLAVGQRLLSPLEAMRAWLEAVPLMGFAVAILVLAWSIQDVCGDLGTSIYLVGAVQDVLAASFLPLTTFGLAAAVAFATGTSWGTMGIMLPAMIPLAFHMTVGSSPLILTMCFAAVLDGAIFGDHCSPISDTTVMSSIASSVDHIDHVETQLPYALTSMSAAAGFGYVGVAFGLPIVVAFLLGVLLFGVILWTFGVSPRTGPDAPEIGEPLEPSDEAGRSVES